MNTDACAGQLSYAAALAIVREVVPVPITDDDAGHILWNETGWPGFFSDGEGVEDAIRRQVGDYVRASGAQDSR